MVVVISCYCDRYRHILMSLVPLSLLPWVKYCVCHGKHTHSKEQFCLQSQNTASWKSDIDILWCSLSLVYFNLLFELACATSDNYIIPSNFVVSGFLVLCILDCEQCRASLNVALWMKENGTVYKEVHNNKRGKLEFLPLL